MFLLVAIRCNHVYLYLQVKTVIYQQLFWEWLCTEGFLANHYVWSELARLSFGKSSCPVFLYGRILLQIKCLYSLKFIYWDIIPKVLVFGHGVWEIIRSYSWSPHDGITTYKEIIYAYFSVFFPASLSLPGENTETRRWPSAGRMKTITQNLSLDFAASGNLRNRFLLFKPPGLWQFVTTLQDASSSGFYLCNMIVDLKNSHSLEIESYVFFGGNFWENF